MTYTNANSTNIIKETICSKEQECKIYLETKYNIFDTGFYFTYKSCFSYLSNFYNDYKGLNKTDIEAIKSIIINGQTLFNSISLGLNNLIYFVKKKIYKFFLEDQNNFLEKYNKLVTLFNTISIIASIFILLFVNIYVFISISTYSTPIKESTYRINCSFFNIKNYKLI